MTNREESGSRVKHGMTGFLALPRYLLPGRYIRRLSPQKRLWVNILGLCIVILFGTWALSSLLTAGKAEAAWFNTNWAYRKAILFSHTAAETNVYLNLSGANALDTSTAGKFQSDCGDLRFTDANGKVLSYYLVSGCGTSTTVVHVFFSSMPAGDQYLYVYYGNPSIANGTKSADFTTSASGITFGSVGSEESTPGMVAEWKFDEGYGTTTKDSTSNGNTGTLTNGPTWQDQSMCVSGKCLLFNSTNSTYVQAASAQSITENSFSATAWFRTTNTTIDMKIISGDSSLHPLGVYHGNLRTCENTCVAGATNVADGKWHFVALIATGSTATIYLDGSSKAEATASTTSTTVSDIFRVSSQGAGSGATAAGFYFNGFIDDPTLYTYTLTQTQLKQQYANGLQQMAQQGGNLSNGLVGYWKMDEASWNGTTGEVKDISGSGLNGQSFNTASTSAGKFGYAGDFSASNSAYVKTTTNVTLASGQGRTFSFWIYPNSIENWSGVFIPYVPNSFGAIMYFGTTGNITNRTCVNDRSSEVTPVPNQWNHILFTYDPVSHLEKSYVNGILKVTTDRTSTGCGAFAANPMYIGDDGGGAVALDGKLDELRYYNRNVTATEVQQLYNFGPPPMAYYDFEEATGTTVNDKSGNGNTATLTSSFTKGKYGKGLLATNNGKGARTNGGISFGSQSFTYEAWVKSADTDGGQNRIMGMNFTSGAYCYFNFNNGNIDGECKDSNTVGGALSSASGASIADNKWHYATLVIDRGANKEYTYVDGVLQATNSTAYTGTFGLPGDTAQFLMGYQTTSATLSLNGSLDDIRLYNYARTSSQIIQDMNGGHPLGGSPVGSEVGWWKFDEGQGTTAHNSGSGGSTYDGTLSCFGTSCTNPTWNTSGKFGKALTFSGNGTIGTFVTASPINVPSTSGSQITLSAWLKPDTSQPENGWFIRNGTTSTDENYGLRLGSPTSGKYGVTLEMYNGSSTVSFSTTGKYIPQSSWSQVTVVFTQGQNFQLYVNGVLRETVTVTGTASQATTSFNIGGHNGSTSQVFSGSIDEVKVYLAALTADNIKVDYTHNASLLLGAVGTESDGKTPSNSSDRSYCPPGDTTSTCGPVGEWKFEEGYGTSVADTSGNGNNGTWNGTGSHWTSGKIGKAGSFDGTDDYVSTSMTSPAQSLTYEAWVKRNDLQNALQYIMAVQNSNSAGGRLLRFSTGGNNYLQFEVLNDTGSIFDANYATTTPANVWTHVAGVLDTSSSAIRLYVNGKLITSTSVTGTFTTQLSSLALGRRPDTSSSFLNGEIDQARVYNYARSASQIAWDYNKGAPVTRYKLDECEGSTVHSSTIPYDPTLNGTITIGGTGTQTAVGTCQTSGTAWGNGASGKYNASLNFDGTDDYVNIAHQSVLDSMPLTVSAWFKFTGNGLRGIVNKYVSASSNGYQIFQFGGNICAWYYVSSGVNISGGGATCPFNVSGFNDGNWHLATFTVDTTGGKLYLDGVLKGSLGWTGTPAVTTTTQNLHIGDYPVSGGENNYFNGQIDDVQIFNYALTVQQVKNLYNNSSAIYFGP